MEIQKGEHDKYRCIEFKEMERFANRKKIDTNTTVVKNFIEISNRYKEFNIFNEGENFIWGASDSEYISDLQIEGQSPEEVVPFKLVGHNCHFWYYKNLKSDKPYVEWEVVLQE